VTGRRVAAGPYTALALLMVLQWAPQSLRSVIVSQRDAKPDLPSADTLAPLTRTFIFMCSNSSNKSKR